MREKLATQVYQIPSVTFINLVWRSLDKFYFSIQGSPEKASNQKKQIFDKYYNQIFSEAKFDLSKSPEYVKRYFEIKREYDLPANNFESSDQKIFYIFYIDNHLNSSLFEKIKFFENVINQYSPNTEKVVSDSRKLIQIKFKERLDAEIKKYIQESQM